jgi:guanosine-3',5'-bis(diphosphate) 3'-pyrophosphohydrolase
MIFINEEIENKEIANQYKELLRISYQRLNDSDKKLIRLAFDTAVKAHANQRRKSGEAYVFHPINVAKIVADQIGLDATSIASALLHDVIEDSDFTLIDINRLMGPTIGKIVEGLTKISHLKKDKNYSTQAENYRKMLLTLNDDVRVILIKIADRLHNMQTMDSMPEEKQIKIASETLYIYAPLAHRIGLYNIKNELEDLSLKYTEPQTYKLIKNKIEINKKGQNQYIKSFSKFISKALNEEKLKYEIKGRDKSIFSIHQKMQEKGVSFDQVYDKFALRIVYFCSSNEEKFIAWKVYSIITDHYTPNPSRLRDWITTPKSNGYEALHITVMGPSNQWVEVQIRSKRMHEIAEKGYATHYKYKQGKQSEAGIEGWLNKLQEVLENNTENDVDFVEDFKLNLYAEEIYVFTPKGEIKSLPKEATALDFAFAIHSEIGAKTIGTRVNGKLVPLSKILQSGDQVEILTSKNTYPISRWLNFVQTSRAKTIIKSFLNDEKKKISNEGELILKRKLKHIKINFNEKTKNHLLAFFEINSVQDLYYNVGLGEIDNIRLKEFATNYKNTFLNFFKKKHKEKIKKIENKNNSLVFGRENESLKYILSNCCNPIPGDPVFGFITINEGINVHKKECNKAISLQSNFSYRVLSAKWIDKSNQEYNSIIKLTGIDNKGLVNEVTRLILNNKIIYITKINFYTEDNFFTGIIHLSVNSKNVLDNLINKLNNINGIDKITRE